MAKEKTDFILKSNRFLDVLLTAVAFIGAYFIKKCLLPDPFCGLTTRPNYYIVLLLVVIIWYLAFDLFNVYESYRKGSLQQILGRMLKAVATSTVGLILCMYLTKISDVSRIMIALFLLLDVLLLGLSKYLIYRTLALIRQKEVNLRHILIIGSKERARDVIIALGSHLDSGYRVVGCMETDQREVGKTVQNGVRVIGRLDQLRDTLLEQVVDEVLFAMPLSLIKDVDAHIAVAEEIGVTVRIVPDWQIHRLMYRPGIGRLQLENFLEIPTMALATTPPKRSELLIKKLLDYSVALIAVVVCLPLLLVISLAIKVSSRGPVFFKQERCGLNGRKFTLYKFRTMVADAENLRKDLEASNEADGPVFKIKKDPRIIPFVGTFLRKTSLDELPQLINVVKGEMSLIGPRPPLPTEVDRYEIWQRRRLSMKPGLTCLWQVAPRRNDIGFKEWMKMDLRYIDNWSLVEDMRILCRTVRVVFAGGGR
jgi:exopolysaccharide biosynthesis polyprenyl glycosylphosphotransferase